MVTVPNAIDFYRVARWLYLKRVPLLPKLIQLIIFLLYNSKISAETKIGKGTYLVVKGVSVVIHPKSVIGDNCVLGIGCRLVGKAPFKHLPSLGNGVVVGPGAIIVGPVIIEDDVIIAANSVVTKSVRKGSIVGGIPAKVIGHVDELDYDLKARANNNEAWAPYMESTK